jgi:hypothetical protein
LEVIKSIPALSHIPVVVAADADDPAFVEAIYSLKANCFIRKPTEVAEFLRCIESCYEYWVSVVTLSRENHKSFKASAASSTDPISLPAPPRRILEAKECPVTPLRIILFLLAVPLGSLGVYTALRRGRHHCAHNDPLCRRDRPCIACYREIFSKADEDPQPGVRAKEAGQSR